MIPDGAPNVPPSFLPLILFGSWNVAPANLSHRAGPERRWCHLGIMGKECSQTFSVPIVSDETLRKWSGAGRLPGLVGHVGWEWGGNEASGPQGSGEGTGKRIHEGRREA